RPAEPDCSHDSKTQEVKPCITHLPYSSISVTRRPVLAVALVGPPGDVHSLEAERAREYFKAGDPLPAVFRDAYVSDVNRAGRTVELKDRPVHGASRPVGRETQTHHALAAVVLDDV